MNSNRRRADWMLDAVLLVGFLLAMLLDVTGLGVHQWLGLAIPTLAIYHLARHWQWATAVGSRFFGSTSASARRNYAIDFALLVLLATIAATGIVISTWFDLRLANYSAWLTVHIAVSLAALGLLVLKIGLHWRWIVTTARRGLFPRPQPQGPQPVLQPVPVRVGRRDFLTVMATVGAVSLIAGTNALDGIATATAAAPAAGSQDATDPNDLAAASAGTTASCTVACGRRCSYPGQCRRYVDTNGNNLCDLGECGSGESATGGNAGTGFGAEGGGAYGRPRPGRGRRSSG